MNDSARFRRMAVKYADVPVEDLKHFLAVDIPQALLDLERIIDIIERSGRSTLREAIYSEEYAEHE